MCSSSIVQTIFNPDAGAVIGTAKNWVRNPKYALKATWVPRTDTEGGFANASGGMLAGNLQGAFNADVFRADAGTNALSLSGAPKDRAQRAADLQTMQALKKKDPKPNLAAIEQERLASATARDQLRKKALSTFGTGSTVTTSSLGLSTSAAVLRPTLGA